MDCLVALLPPEVCLKAVLTPVAVMSHLVSMGTLSVSLCRLLPSPSAPPRQQFGLLMKDSWSPRTRLARRAVRGHGLMMTAFCRSESETANPPGSRGGSAGVMTMSIDSRSSPANSMLPETVFMCVLLDVAPGNTVSPCDAAARSLFPAMLAVPKYPATETGHTGASGRFNGEPGMDYLEEAEHWNRYVEPDSGVVL